MNRLDLLAFGAHPDDVEIGMSGTIIQHTKKGYKAGICDLTLAELSSNGSVERRQQEAKEASEQLGLHTRINLELPDRGLQFNEMFISKIVRVIRTYQPKIIFLPYPEDRHPDHGNCTKLVEEAVFSAGIRRFQSENDLAPHKVDHVYYYFINGYDHPQVAVDITNEMKAKINCLRAYKSQFVSSEGGIETPLNNGYLEAVEARDTLFGKETGVQYAEGFITKRPILVDTLIGAAR
ncbi:bacillithiol biosynthesis deacetylase BshB1 [Alkalihalobacillus sp. AL-G]|uniref:bacillithiol biosynthesis deacetylase BshB1 n=1 Tax=Alkalihalobacillus sp. AL-G TaxID=2926399 RepID=UPI00272A010F|nr:bacillithiol biosynthesis deacetylase BshB1 [Alkalihalobacillus sp. AL-G]WLD91803.1 bacillithiol biosynthesis deacetylase BshB1 [Alkalihalobacillus sp. AL-G]